MRLSKLLFLTVFVFFSFPCFAKEEVPVPDGRVNDFAGVISSEYKEKISSLVQELEQKTSAEICVVTRSSIEPYGENEYAQLLFDNWKIGKKGKDNGVLILLAVKERRWRIHTGYGVEGILPDGTCGEIGRTYMVPYFKDGKYSEGLYYGVAAVANIICKDANVTLNGLNGINFEEKSKSEGVPAFVFLLVFLFFIMLSFLRPRSMIYGGGFGGGGFGGGGFGGGSSGGGGAGGGF